MDIDRSEAQEWFAEAYKRAKKQFAEEAKIRKKKKKGKYDVCGTTAGPSKHRREGTEACEPCREVRNKQKAEYRERNREEINKKAREKYHLEKYGRYNK